jgi:hypothetical protein
MLAILFFSFKVLMGKSNFFKNFFFIIVILNSLVSIVAYSAPLELKNTSLIRTAYFNVSTKEFRLPNEKSGWGGQF